MFKKVIKFIIYWLAATVVGTCSWASIHIVHQSDKIGNNWKGVIEGGIFCFGSKLMWFLADRM